MHFVFTGRLLTKQEAQAYLAAPVSRHVLVPEESPNYWVAVTNPEHKHDHSAFIGRDYVMAAAISGMALGGEEELTRLGAGQLDHRTRTTDIRLVCFISSTFVLTSAPLVYDHDATAHK